MTPAVERVVVALDAASENRAAISAAVRLAARWKTRLHGVFVEDDDLIRLAHLPFARQVMLGGTVEVLSLQQAERQLRVFAERARQDLAAAAERHKVEWSFEIVRGGSSRLAVTAGDFLVAGTATRPIGGHFRVEGRWWAVESVPATRLLAYREGDPSGGVAALLRGREASSGRLITTAARLAEANDARLTVICETATAQAPGFKTWLDETLAGHAVEMDVELMPERALLIRRIANLRCRLVAVEAGTEEARTDRLREMVATTGCDVLVVG